MDTPDVNAAPSPANEVSPTMEEIVASFTGPVRDEYRLHGFDAALALRDKDKTPDVTAESSTAPAESKDEIEPEPAPGPAQPKDDAAEKSRKARERNAQRWDELLEERGSLKKENELLRKQLAERTAPPNATEEPKPPEKPKRPRMKDFDGDDALERYEAALDKFDADTEAYQARKFDERLQSVARQPENEGQSWEEQIAEESEIHRDFEAVAFNSNVPASETMIRVMVNHKAGAKVAYYLGQHPDEAKELAIATDIPGIRTPEQFQAFVKKAETDPKTAKTLARTEGVVESEFNRIAKTLQKPSAAPPKPAAKPLPKPTQEVSVQGRGSPALDDEEEAVKSGNQAAFNRIRNKRDLEKQGAL